MSYIVAFVKYREGKGTYPVNCWRTDLAVGDGVVVRQMSDREVLKEAVVIDLQFLNWRCKNYIECRSTECTYGPDGIALPVPSKTLHGMTRPIDLWHVLKPRGWKLRKPAARQFKSAFFAFNGKENCTMFFRSNGIDIQIFPGSGSPLHYDNGTVGFSSLQGRHVRHTLSHSGINVYEHVDEFAAVFLKADDYARFMKPLGTTDKRTDKLRQMAAEHSGDGLYATLGGDGLGPIYLGDGLSIGPGDSWHNG